MRPNDPATAPSPDGPRGRSWKRSRVQGHRLADRPQLLRSTASGVRRCRSLSAWATKLANNAPVMLIMIMAGVNHLDQIHQRPIGALMQPLEKGMPSVPPGDTRRSGSGSPSRDPFAIGFHVGLLQVSRQPPAAVVWNDGMPRKTKMHPAPIPQQAEKHWCILTNWSFGEMPIHGGCTGQQGRNSPRSQASDKPMGDHMLGAPQPNHEPNIRSGSMPNA